MSTLQFQYVSSKLPSARARARASVTTTPARAPFPFPVSGLAESEAYTLVQPLTPMTATRNLRADTPYKSTRTATPYRKVWTLSHEQRVELARASAAEASHGLQHFMATAILQKCDSSVAQTPKRERGPEPDLRTDEDKEELKSGATRTAACCKRVCGKRCPNIDVDVDVETHSFGLIAPYGFVKKPKVVTAASLTPRREGEGEGEGEEKGGEEEEDVTSLSLFEIRGERKATFRTGAFSRFKKTLFTASK